MTEQLFSAIFFSIALLLLLVLRFRLNAFLALLIASIGFGLSAGIPTEEIITNIKFTYLICSTIEYLTSIKL